jgi:hypothetical protein
VICSSLQYIEIVVILVVLIVLVLLAVLAAPGVLVALVLLVILALIVVIVVLLLLVVLVILVLVVVLVVLVGPVVQVVSEYTQCSSANVIAPSAPPLHSFPPGAASLPWDDRVRVPNFVPFWLKIRELENRIAVLAPALRLLSNGTRLQPHGRRVSHLPVPGRHRPLGRRRHRVPRLALQPLGLHPWGCPYLIP